MTIYRVENGETIEQIARKFNTTAAIIERDNPAFYAGARLIIRCGLVIHVVKPFETLSKIAERYGTTTQELVRINNMKTPLLYAGYQLVIREEDDE